MMFIVEAKPISWNTLLRKNHWIVKKAFDELKFATIVAIRIYNLKPVSAPCAHIYVTACWKGKRIHDCDNIVAKPIIDTLVEQKILPRDDISFVEQVTLAGMNEMAKDYYRVEIL